MKADVRPQTIRPTAPLLDRLGATGSLLPPLQGSLSTPRLEIAGATLEGVEVGLDDPGITPRDE